MVIAVLSASTPRADGDVVARLGASCRGWWLAPADEPSPAARPAPGGAERSDSPVPLRVLVIEDNLDAAQTLHDLLLLSEYEVRVAYTGPEGVQRAREFLPHVVLCDLGLPGLNGYEVAAALQREPAVAHARLIALTGYNTAADQRRSREAGFEVHLAKPVDLEVLEQLLAAAAATLS